MAYQPTEGHLVQCKCVRYLLVEIILIGVSHNIYVHATCWECLN